MNVDWIENLKPAKVVVVDKVDYVPKDEYIFKVSDVQKLVDIAVEVDEPVIVVGGRIAMVIDRRKGVPVRYLYKHG